MNEQENCRNYATGGYRKHVTGWLSFFLFTVGVGAAITVVYHYIACVDMNTPLCVNGQPYFLHFSIRGFMAYFQVFSVYYFAILYACIFPCILYAIISFVKIRPNAVFLGKSYLIVLFLYNLFWLFLPLYDNYGFIFYPRGYFDTFKDWLCGVMLMYSVVWFVYLCVSEQVKELFPKEKRVVLKRDKCLIASLLIIFVVFFLYVWIQQQAMVM